MSDDENGVWSPITQDGVVVALVRFPLSAERAAEFMFACSRVWPGCETGATREWGALDVVDDQLSSVERGYLNAGSVMEAIKVYRHRTGAPLKEAKAVIDRARERRSPRLSNAAPAHGDPAGGGTDSE